MYFYLMLKNLRPVQRKLCSSHQLFSKARCFSLAMWYPNFFSLSSPTCLVSPSFSLGSFLYMFFLLCVPLAPLLPGLLLLLTLQSRVLSRHAESAWSWFWWALFLRDHEWQESCPLVHVSAGLWQEPTSGACWREMLRGPPGEHRWWVMESGWDLGRVQSDDRSSVNCANCWGQREGQTPVECVPGRSPRSKGSFSCLYIASKRLA